MKRNVILALAAVGALLGTVAVVSAATNGTPNTTAPISASAEGAEPAESSGEAPGAAETDGIDHQFEGEENHTD